MRNVHVSHCNITNSTRGIGIFLRDEGSLENITFSDLYIESKLHTGDWWGNGEPIHISAVRGKENVKLGTIKNVLFQNITCKAENGMLIYGSDESIIKDIRFDNVSVEMVNSKLNTVAGGNIDLRGCLSEQEQLFASDIPGLMARYVDGLSIHNFKLSWDPTINQSYFTNGIELSHFKNLSITNFTGGGAPNNRDAHRMQLTEGGTAVLDSREGLKTNEVSDLKILQ